MEFCGVFVHDTVIIIFVIHGNQFCFYGLFALIYWLMGFCGVFLILGQFYHYLPDLQGPQYHWYSLFDAEVMIDAVIGVFVILG